MGSVFFFTADYIRRIILDRLEAQIVLESGVEIAFKSTDVILVVIAKAKLASLFIKDWALVIRDRLNRMSANVTNIVAACSNLKYKLQNL